MRSLDRRVGFARRDAGMVVGPRSGRRSENRHTLDCRLNWFGFSEVEVGIHGLREFVRAEEKRESADG